MAPNARTVLMTLCGAGLGVLVLIIEVAWEQGRSSREAIVWSALGLLAAIAAAVGAWHWWRGGRST